MTGTKKKSNFGKKWYSPPRGKTLAQRDVGFKGENSGSA